MTWQQGTKVKVRGTDLIGRSEVFFPVTKTRFPSGAMVKNPPANAGDKGDTGSILGSGRSPGGGNDNPLQYSCLENSTDRGA